jgi:hypothetical protein
MNPFRQWILNQILNSGAKAPNQEELLSSLKKELRAWFVDQMSKSGIPSAKQDELLEILEKEFLRETDLDKTLDTLTNDVLSKIQKHIEEIAKTVEAHRRQHRRRTNKRGKALWEDRKTEPDGDTDKDDDGREDLDIEED